MKPNGPGEGGPHVGQARPAVPKHPRSAGLRLWGVQYWVRGTRLGPTYRATLGCGLSRGASGPTLCVSFGRLVWW